MGVRVTFAAALLPALRASRLSPMAALREEVSPAVRLRAPASRHRRRGHGARRRRRSASRSGRRRRPGLRAARCGVLIIFVGLADAGPADRASARRILGAPGAALAGVAGKLGRENAMRNPQRTAQTATALTIGLALVTFVTVFATSLSTSIGPEHRPPAQGRPRRLRRVVVPGVPAAAGEAVAKEPLVRPSRRPRRAPCGPADPSGRSWAWIPPRSPSPTTRSSRPGAGAT